MEKQELEKHGAYEQWTSAYVTFGILTGVNKEDMTITVDSKVGDEWGSETFGWKDDQELPELACLGEDHELKIVSRAKGESRTPGQHDTVYGFHCEHDHK